MRRRLRIGGRRRCLGWRRGRRSRQHERARAGEHVAARRHERRAADPRARDEQPRGGEGAARRAEHVDAVERADRAPGRTHVAHHRPHQERQRHAHQHRRRQRASEVHEAGGPGWAVEAGGERVEPVVVEPAGSRRRRAPIASSTSGEGDERRPRREARAQHAAQVAADAEPGHERAPRSSRPSRARRRCEGRGCAARRPGRRGRRRRSARTGARRGGHGAFQAPAKGPVRMMSR